MGYVHAAVDKIEESGLIKLAEKAAKEYRP
jgi:hypothetical protein